MMKGEGCYFALFFLNIDFQCFMYGCTLWRYCESLLKNAFLLSVVSVSGNGSRGRGFFVLFRTSLYSVINFFIWK